MAHQPRNCPPLRSFALACVLFQVRATAARSWRLKATGWPPLAVPAPQARRWHRDRGPAHTPGAGRARRGDPARRQRSRLQRRSWRRGVESASGRQTGRQQREGQGQARSAWGLRRTKCDGHRTRAKAWPATPPAAYRARLDCGLVTRPRSPPPQPTTRVGHRAAGAVQLSPISHLAGDTPFLPPPDPAYQFQVDNMPQKWESDLLIDKRKIHLLNY